MALNSLLSSAPGMDWTTMSNLYGNIDDYQTQLRKLEAFCQAHPKDSAAEFVLAYHYLVTGSQDAAVNALKMVVANQPRDVTARRMLDALTRLPRRPQPCHLPRRRLRLCRPPARPRRLRPTSTWWVNGEPRPAPRRSI